MNVNHHRCLNNRVLKHGKTFTAHIRYGKALSSKYQLTV
jgi:hypothetical protein